MERKKQNNDVYADFDLWYIQVFQRRHNNMPTKCKRLKNHWQANIPYGNGALRRMSYAHNNIPNNRPKLIGIGQA